MIYTGSMTSLDAAQDMLGEARKDWIKNTAVSIALYRAMQEIARARGVAADQINKSNGVQVSLD